VLKAFRAHHVSVKLTFLFATVEKGDCVKAFPTTLVLERLACVPYSEPDVFLVSSDNDVGMSLSTAAGVITMYYSWCLNSIVITGHLVVTVLFMWIIVRCSNALKSVSSRLNSYWLFISIRRIRVACGCVMHR
jgi:hypothetical protein